MRGSGGHIVGAALFLVGLAMALLGSCTTEPPNQGAVELLPLSDEPVVIVIWEHGELLPRLLLAEDAEQDGEQLQHTLLRQVMVRLPMDEGEIMLRTPQATIDEGEAGTIHLASPVHFSGAMEQYPMIGRARRAQMTLRDSQVELFDVEWLHMGQWVRIDHLLLRDEWRERRAEQLRGEPLPAVWQAAQAALPQPLAFPVFRRGQGGFETGGP